MIRKREAIIFVLIGFVIFSLINTQRKKAEGYNGGFSSYGLVRDNGSNSNSTYVTQSEDSNTITIPIEFKLPIISEITINGTQYDRIKMDDLNNIGNPGEPSLPVKSLKIRIPYDKSIVDTGFVYGEEVILDGIYHIEPSHEEVPLSNPNIVEAILPDQLIYESSEPFPKQHYRLVAKQKLYEFEIIIFNIYPVKYEPLNGRISYYKRLTLTVNLKQKPGGTLDSSSNDFLYFRRNFQEYDERIKAFVDNPYTESRLNIDSNSKIEEPLRDLYEYLIITDEGFKDSFQPLIDYKENNKNLTASIKTTKDIYDKYDDEGPDGAKDNQTKIRDFIRYSHKECDTDYVLLGGDTNIIPQRILYDTTWKHTNPIQCKIASDLYYACLDGTFDYNKNGIYGEKGDGDAGGEVDLLAEVFIGRAPVSTIEEVENFVKKTLSHEKANEELDANDWKNLMVGEYLGYHYSEDKKVTIREYAEPYLEEIRLGSDKYGYTTKGIIESSIQSFKLYNYDIENQQEKQQLIDYMNNENIHFYNHMGHSSVNENMGLTNHDVEDLINTTPFFIYSQGCYAASFDNIDEDGNPKPYDCIAEHFVNADYGAFAYIGNTRYGWYDKFSTNGSSQRFHRLFWDFILEKGIKQLGRANQLSKEANIGLIEKDRNRWCYFQITLLGDPELSIGSFVPKIYTFSAQPTDQYFDCEGGSESINVNTQSGNSWTAISSDPAWLQITSGASGSGTGTIHYMILANHTSTNRTGTITIYDENNQVRATFNVNQDFWCPYTLSSSTRDFECPAGEGNFQVNTLGGCQWTAAVSSSDSTWLQITSGASGSGTGIVYYKLTENIARSSHSATISIKDKDNQVRATFNVNQDFCCPYTLSSSTRDFECLAGEGNFSVNTNSGCQWTAVVSSSDSAWLQITSGASGSSTGTVYYKVTENTTCPSRIGTISIKNKNNQVKSSFRVNQEGGNCCPYTLSSSTRNFECSAGEGNFSVNTNSGCQWTAAVSSSDSAWLQITSGASGSGTGTVYYKFIENTASSSRSGTISIKDKNNQVKTSFRVNQEGGCVIHIVGSCNTLGPARDLDVQGSYAYVALGYSGLQVIDISNPKQPTISGSCDTPGSAESVHVQGSYAFVADGRAGLQVINISDPQKPAKIGSFNTTSSALSVYVQGSYAFVAADYLGLLVIDITNPQNPQKVGSCVITDAKGVYIQDSYAYVVRERSGLGVINISNPKNPYIEGLCDTPGSTYKIHVQGSYAYVADRSKGLEVINITNPKNPTLVNSCKTDWAEDVYVQGSYAYVADAESGLQVIDIKNPQKPAIACPPCDTPGYVNGVYVQGSYAYIADWDSGLQVIDLMKYTSQ